MFLKKLFSLTVFYRRESDGVVANLKYELDNKEMESEYRSLKGRADLYHDLFWHIVREYYSLWLVPCTDLRKNWVIVETISQEDNIFQRIFGGQL